MVWYVWLVTALLSQAQLLRGLFAVHCMIDSWRCFSSPVMLFRVLLLFMIWLTCDCAGQSSSAMCRSFAFAFHGMMDLLDLWRCFFTSHAIQIQLLSMEWLTCDCASQPSFAIRWSFALDCDFLWCFSVSIAKLYRDLFVFHCVIDSCRCFSAKPSFTEIFLLSMVCWVLFLVMVWCISVFCASQPSSPTPRSLILLWWDIPVAVLSVQAEAFKIHFATFFVWLTCDDACLSPVAFHGLIDLCLCISGKLCHTESDCFSCHD